MNLSALAYRLNDFTNLILLILDALLAPDGDKPFNRSPHWAFELRRIDGVEKFDLVILHSDVGAYQLKRVREEARSTVNIARTLLSARCLGFQLADLN